MQEREIHLRDYIRVIKKRRFTVYTFFIIVFTIVLIGTLSTTPVYKASTKVLIERGEPTGLTRNYYYMPYDPEFYETQYQLIKSASVAEKVVDMLSLQQRYKQYFPDQDDSSGLISKLFGWLKSDEAESGAENKGIEKEALIKMISSGITVRPVKNSKIVEISYLSTNPEFATAVANTVAKAYMNEILELKMRSSRYKLQWLTEKAEEERKKLQKAEEALQRYMKDNDIVTLENRITIIPQRLTELSTQLTKAEAKRKELESLYNRIKRLTAKNIEKAETIPAISSDPTVQALREEILKAEQNVMELSKKFGRKHPKMIRAVSELNILKEKKAQEIRRVIESIKTEYELARANENNLRTLLKKTKDEALWLNEKFIQYGVLKREVETNRQLYDALIKKIKEESITEKVQTVNVWIVEEAKRPEFPVKPRKMLNIALGIIVGLFGGVGLAFFVEYLDNTIKTPDEAESRLGMPVLGMVSCLKENGEGIEKVVLNDPKSTFAENYKVLRTSILLSAAERPPKTILITSAGPDEGKTSTATNLATAIAQSEYTVLLIDADLRKPRLHKIFGLENSKGLTTYLAGASDMNIIQEGPLPNMSVITSGPIPPNPSELLSSNRMQKLLEALKDRYDVIILDSPPLMTVSDSMILSKLSEGTIIVTKSASTTYEMVSRCIKSLKDINVNILGLVINAVDIKKADYYYYYRYYGYYYEDKEGDSGRPAKKRWWIFLPVTAGVALLLIILLWSFFHKEDIPSDRLSTTPEKAQIKTR